MNRWKFYLFSFKFIHVCWRILQFSFSCVTIFSIETEENISICTCSPLITSEYSYSIGNFCNKKIVQTSRVITSRTSWQNSQPLYKQEVSISSAYTILHPTTIPHTPCKVMSALWVLKSNVLICLFASGCMWLGKWKQTDRQVNIQTLRAKLNFVKKKKKERLFQ